MSEQRPIGKEKKQAGPKPRGASWRVLLGAQRCILPHRPQLITMAKQERRGAVGTGQSQRPAWVRWRATTSVCGHRKVWKPDLEDSPVGMEC